jgi:cytochrome c oxidase cbb3-type subunit 2
MNKGPVIFIGVLVIMVWSWYGFIYKNFTELGRLEPVRPEGAGMQYPGRVGAAQRGQEVYRANNCAACHTMQVRAEGVTEYQLKKVPGTVERNFDYVSADLQRGWGVRPTVLQDFTLDQHIFLGGARLGPDLANVGMRQPNPGTLLTHLYNPRLAVPNSTMPPYQFLFAKRKIGPLPSRNALNIPNTPAGYEIVPSAKAQDLVAYLQSLRGDVSIFESPLPQMITNTVEEASTNAAPAGTAPAK